MYLMRESASGAGAAPARRFRDAGVGHHRPEAVVRVERVDELDEVGQDRDVGAERVPDAHVLDLDEAALARGPPERAEVDLRDRRRRKRGRVELREDVPVLAAEAPLLALDVGEDRLERHGPGLLAALAERPPDALGEDRRRHAQHLADLDLEAAVRHGQVAEHLGHVHEVRLVRLL